MATPHSFTLFGRASTPQDHAPSTTIGRPVGVRSGDARRTVCPSVGPMRAVIRAISDAGPQPDIEQRLAGSG